MEDIYNGTSSVLLGMGYVTEPGLNDTSSTEEFGEYDYSDLRSMAYPRPRHSLPWWEITLKLFFYAVIILIALIGNALVILVVIRDKRMRTTTNFYIVNLATSDLLVALSCAWVHLVNSLSENWVLGAFFCKFNSFVQGKYTTKDMYVHHISLAHTEWCSVTYGVTNVTRCLL